MDFTNLLNKEQLQGVVTNSQYVRVIAGAGSGKTRVLTYRIAHLLLNCNVLPYQILGWTFTNKAAREIKDRVYKIVEPQEGDFNIFLGTIHSWCAFFLRRYANLVDYPKNFTIIDDDDQLAIIKEIFVSHGYPKSDLKIKECLNWIASKKTKGYQYEDLKDEEFPNADIRRYLEYYGEYTQILKERKSFDFDDLLLKAIEILENFSEVRETMFRKIKYILVDEFQDINDVQFRLIELLMNEETSLYVVGDPDQTIYTWRGANHRIILDLEKSLKDINPNQKLETIILDKNYRSTKSILDCANNLIVNNQERVKKELVCVNQEGDKVNFFNARTMREEAHHIISTIVELHKNEKVKYKDIAILYRSNYLTRELESTLSSYRVPYRVYGGQKFFQRREIKDIISYFRLIVNDADDTAFDRIINVPKRGIGPTTLEKISNEANKLGQTKYSYLSENINEAPISAKQKALLLTMTTGINKMRNLIENNSQSFVQELYDFITQELGYFSYLEEDDKNTFDERKENVEELFSSLQNQMEENSTLSFEDFVTSSMLQSSQDEVDLNSDFVSLMTVHTAKGLEFDYVFVFSLGQGVFPAMKSIVTSKKGIEEERRLAYVAFTRAKKKLYLSSNQDYSFAIQGPLRPSQFVKEAGIKYSYMDDSRFIEREILPPPIVKKKEEKIVNDSRLTNGVSSWNIGDRLEHEKFGQGEVTQVINQLIVVKFDDPSFGKKTFLGSHISIKKL